MKALVVGGDPEMVDVFSQLFSELDIETDRCALESAAIDQLSSGKFEALVLDVDDVAGYANILERMKASRQNRNLLVFAVASDSRAQEAASASGDAFIIRRPLVASHIRDLLCREYGRMLRDSQAYFRLAVELPVSIRRGSGNLLQCTTTNLSQSGMAIRTPFPLDIGEQLIIAFAVPNTDVSVNADGTVIWDDRHGRAGIRFQCSSPVTQLRFFEWLHDHFFVRFDRMQTELSLAHHIQATLVPTISFQTSRFEVYGKSLPSTEMGGDLIDVVEIDGGLLAYVADISGHGLPAGQLMGMLKTAIRVSLQFHQEPVALLESADRVLPSVKGPGMYATVALLYFNGSVQVEYALAGHVPILHYRRRSGDTVRLAMEQFPLGLIPGGSYASERVNYSPGDLFLMLTDGITETASQRGEEFGLASLEELLTESAAPPLQRIWELVMDGVKRHGMQRDDQSLLLLRVRDRTPGSNNRNSCLEEVLA
jgi:CheY-like chemotaxis protein